MADDSSDDERKRRETPPPLEFIRTDEPPAGPPAPERPAAWVPRPEEYIQPPQGPTPQPWPQAPRPGSPRALIGGILLILSGLIGAAGAFIVFTQPLTPADIAVIQNMTAGDLATNALFVFLVVYAQAFAYLGGIMAIQRKNWKLAVFCGVASLLNFGILFLGSIAGLVGLVLIITSRREFLG